MRHIIRSGIASLSFILAITGCSDKPRVTEVPQAYKNLMIIRDAYFKATDKLQRPPANREELLPYLKESGDPDEILKSANDGEEFVILYGVNYRTVQLQPVTVYEKKGRNGKRLVLRTKVIFTMNDEELKQAPFPPGQSAPI